MSAEYRGLASEAEWADGLVLWEKVFGVGPWLFHSLHRAHQDRDLADCSIAVVNGEIVSAVDFFAHPLFDAKGTPRKMGGIGSVATHPEHRRQGHSQLLLTRALEKMEARGCEWSLLFTGVNDHYAKQGWKTIPLWHYRTVISESSRTLPEGWEIIRKSYWHPGEPAQLAPLYDKFHGARPLAHQRTSHYWDVGNRERLNRPNRITLLANQSGQLRGYGIVDLFEGWFELHELTGGEEATAAVLCGLKDLLMEKGITEGSLSIPRSQGEDPWIKEFFPTMTLHESSHGMARPIADRMSWDEVEAIFADPRAIHHRLDDF